MGRSPPPRTASPACFRSSGRGSFFRGLWIAVDAQLLYVALSHLPRLITGYGRHHASLAAIDNNNLTSGACTG
jgi:hypothetical protein